MPTPPEPTPTPSDVVSTEDYASLTEAFAAVPDQGTVILASNITEEVVIDDGRTLTLDLNGNTLSANSGVALKVTNGNLTIENGKIEGTDARGLTLDTRTSNGEVSITLGEDVEVFSENNLAIFLVGKNVELNSAATIASNNDTYAAVSGNGSYSGTTLNITDGSISAPNNIGIYFPQGGELNISGGDITGHTALYAKSGNISITGGTFTGIGEQHEYLSSTDGTDATGDAIVFDCQNYPGGNPVVEISGGTFISNNAVAVGSYANEKLEPLTGFITGGTYSSDISGLCVEGYQAIQSGDKWVVVKNS